MARDLDPLGSGEHNGGFTREGGNGQPVVYDNW